MAKAILNLGYGSYVMNMEQAVVISEMLAKAELYVSKYHRDKDTGTATSTHHIYENDSSELGTLKLVSDEFYRLSKLAGKPADEK
ncbi:hypothetical protein EBT31_15315 [bacterium]|jgi:hypothetical protein|nr:hypothetical protein [bacterium]